LLANLFNLEVGLMIHSVLSTTQQHHILRAPFYLLKANFSFILLNNAYSLYKDKTLLAYRFNFEGGLTIADACSTNALIARKQLLKPMKIQFLISSLYQNYIKRPQGTN
jgi:hypothetical protein